MFFLVKDQKTTNEIGLLSLQKAFANNEGSTDPCYIEKADSYTVHEGRKTTNVVISYCTAGNVLTQCRDVFIYYVQDCDGETYEEYDFGELEYCN